MSEPEQDSSAPGHQKAEGGLSGIAGVVRPLVKEVVKVGLVAYETVSETASGIGKQFNELLEEARSEAVKSPSSDNAPAQNDKKGAEIKGGKVKHAHGKGS